MSDTELKKQYPPVQGAAEERQPQGEVKDISKLLSSFGGSYRSLAVDAHI